MQKIKISTFLLSTICLTIFTGCSLFSEMKTPQKEEELAKTAESSTPTIKILMSEWPPDLISYLAQENGYFEKHGANVEILKTQGFEDMVETRSKTKGPKIWAYTILDFILEQHEGVIDGQIFLVEDHSAGADAILAMPESGIEKIEDLEGKTIGVEVDTSGEMFLHILLDEVGLSFDDITIADIASEDIRQALLDNTINAGEAYEPSITESISNGAIVIIDSEYEKNAIVDVLVTDKKYAEMYPEEYQKFVAGFLDAVEFYETYPDEAVQIMSEPYGISALELKKALSNIELTNNANNKLIFQKSSGSDSLFILMRRAEKYLESKGYLIDESKFDDYINTKIIQNISD